MNLEDGIEILKKWDKLYEIGKSPVSDLEYDKFKSDLIKKYGKSHQYFSTVGVAVENKKITLPYVIGSLNKQKLHNIDTWLSNHKTDIVVSAKLDGMSFVVVYVDGKVKFAATRGNGRIGVNITSKLKNILPQVDGNVCLRGEILLPGDIYKELGYKNRRNAVAGIINRDDTKYLEHLVLYFHEVIDPQLNNEIDRINFLKLLNVKLPYIEIEKYSTKDKLVKILSTFKQYAIEDGIDIDGLVLTPIDYIRENVAYPKHKVAFKVNEDGIETSVVGIEWNTTRTGKVVPIIEIDPVEINGSTISRVTGFNFKYIKDNEIGIGTKLAVIKSGDVIPYITDVITFVDSDVKTLDRKNGYYICPQCKSILVEDGVNLVCKNTKCSPYTKIAYFFRTLGVEYISEKTIENLNVSTIEEMYNLNEFEISMIDGFGLIRAQKIVDEIEKTLTTKEYLLLAAFGIPGIGKENAKKIINVLSIDELFKINKNDIISKLSTIQGIGQKTAGILAESIKEYESFYSFLCDKGLKFKETKSKISGIQFALTGASPSQIKRNTYVNIIEDNGGIVKGVSKKTDYLVAADPNGNSSKLKKARKYSIKIISYNELEEMLGIKND